VPDKSGYPGGAGSHEQGLGPLRASFHLPERTTTVAGIVSVAAVLAFQLIVFPVPAGVWIQGLVLGLLGSLMAVGLGLTYRLNKVVNFAQGDLGTAPAVLAVGLIGFSGVNYFLGLATGLVAVVLLTFCAEFVVIRRFRRSPRLILTVAAIGLSQFLVVVSLLIPRIWGQSPISTAVVSFPWHFGWHIAPIVFNADDLMAVIVSVVCLAGVSFWFTMTDVGIAVQAAGDRRDRASMLGIPVGRLQSVTWVVAGTLSFVSIFFQAAILGLPLDPTYGLTALVTALAALALGNFTELPVIAASAVALGVLQQGVAWDEPSNPSLGLAVLAGVVFAAILVRQLFARRTDRAADPTLALAGSARDLSAAARDLTEVKVGVPALGLVAFAAACTLPLWMGPGELIRASSLVVLAIVGCSIVVLTGWSGQVSLGQMSFAAVGAAVGAVAVLDWHWDLSLALLLAGAAAAVVAVVVGIPTLRLDGMFAAVTTLAFALAASGYLLVRAEFSWIPQSQINVPYLFGAAVTSQASVFELCLGVLILVLAALHGLRHSRTGRVLRALPSNQRAASGYGIHVVRAKLTAFALSGFIAGLGGCLLLVVNQSYEENSFLVPASLIVFTSTAVGGLGSALGAVLGAAIVEGSTVYLPPSWQLFPSALGVLLVLILFPRGLSGLVEELRDYVAAALLRRHDHGATATPTPSSSPSGAMAG
jgi:branched-chain amino acid transport system permease protein